LLFSETTIWLSTGTKLEFKRGRDTPIDTVDTVLSACCFVRCLKFVLLSFLSFNDDGESNVLEGIQNLELLTDLRETL